MSWGGFKSTVAKDVASNFCRVRLWDQSKLIAEFLSAYDRLDEDIKAEVPIKTVFAPAMPEGAS